MGKVNEHGEICQGCGNTIPLLVYDFDSYDRMIADLNSDIDLFNVCFECETVSSD